MTKKNLRRLFTASVSSALLISLASCSAAKNNTGKIPSGDYATAGSYKVSNNDLWNELKWYSSDVLETQVTNVVLNKYLTRINYALSKDSLTADEQKACGYSDTIKYSDAEFKKLKDTYENRLVDYVVQDIYDFTFSNEDYWDQFEDMEHIDIDRAEVKYVDAIYQEYLIDSIGGKTIKELIKNADYKNYEDKKADYLVIAKGLSQIYYPLLAKELLAYDTLETEIQEALEDDEDDDDSTWGLFDTSDYVAKFTSEYTCNYDISAITIDFVDNDDLNDTLRAFGLKLYKKQFYYIYDSADEDEYTITNGQMTYEDYIEYYDDFANSDLGNTKSTTTGAQICTIVPSNAVLEIFIQIYNYVNGGYREKLASTQTFTNYTQLNDLRKLTDEIISAYSVSNGDELLKAASDKVLAENKDQTYFTAEDITDTYGSSLKTYLYENAKSEKDSCFTTSGQSTSVGYTLAYKLADHKNLKDEEEIDASIQAHIDWYNSDTSTYDILDRIQDTENFPTLLDDLTALLKKDKVTSSKISSSYKDAAEDATVKIYNEACEIAYSKSHDDYSKAVKKNKNSNVLATIKYDDVTWNVNIYQDDADKNSVVIPGTDTKFGVFNYLEKQYGATTATTLINRQVIKNSTEYADLLKDKDKYSLYETYIENILYNFSNDGLSSSGYSSSIGKYNFLMLYFHTADIDEIITEYYLVSAAQSRLLNDYSSDSVLNFISTYSEIAKEKYFSLSGERLYVYIDVDGDGKEDTDFDWTKAANSTDFPGATYEVVAKELLVEIYNQLSASTTNHQDKLSSIATEFNAAAKAEYEANPISPENTWAKYRKLGLKVKTATYEATNTTVDIDFTLKQRLYDYATNKDGKYPYFMNNTAPSVYIENIDTTEAVKENNDTFVKTKEGYNLILVTGGTASASAKWEEKDHNEGILTDIKIKYNDKTVTISDIFNSTDDLTANQIKFYVLDYAVNGSATLAPSSLSSVYAAYLEPVMSRFTGSETQRIIMLNNIAKETGATSAYDAIVFANEAYNGENGIFQKLIQINENAADDYIGLYDDTTGTSDLYTVTDGTTSVSWWDAIRNLVGGNN